VTTATRATAPSGVILRAAVVSVVVLTVLGLVAGLASGRPAALGVLAGGALVLGVFWAGTAGLEVMTRKSAEMALLVAMVTYSTQIIVVLGALLALRGTGAIEDLSRGWLAAAVLAGSTVWSVAQIALAARARIPTYAAVEGAEADCYVPARQASSAAPADSPITTAERP
jgi:hypothetical protein